MSQLDYIEDRYGDGECGPFALALHELTGLPVVVFPLRAPDGYLPVGFPRHAALDLGDGTYLDAYGVRDQQTIARGLQAVLSSASPADLNRYPFEAGPGSEDHEAAEFAEVVRHAREMLTLRELERLLQNNTPTPAFWFPP